MFKKLILVAIFTIISFAEVVTTTSVKSAEGVGIGVTREEAISNAIAEALGQINGIRISKESLKTVHSVKTNDGHKGVYTYNNSIKRITKGNVDSFKIIDVNEVEGRFEAIVSVTNSKTTKKYKTPGLNLKNRRSIIVIPANINYDSFQILGEYKSAVSVNINLSQELLNAITQTRKFNVLDREENRAFFDEQNVISSEDAGRDEVLKLGQVLGSDYILLTSIKEISIGKEKPSAYIASTNNSYKASVTVQFKVITTATRQVKFSNTRTFDFEPSGNSNKQIYYDTLKQISNKISAELIENIYPLKILDVNNNEITINQGNLSLGSRYHVFKLGAKIVDSYTKESLGTTETNVGTVEIIRVLPKYSIAKIIEGKISKDNIARLISEGTEKGEFEKIGKESDVEIKSNGGVVLPFD